MAGATNTIIQILRSDVTAYPVSLEPGEQAYSYVSDKLFVGNTDNTVITIGGKYYVDLLDNASAPLVGNTIVRRDDAGNAAFTMVSVTDDASQSTDVVNKNYLDTRINALSSNTIYSGAIGVDGYSNVHTSNTDAGGSVILVANNTLVSKFTANLAEIYVPDTAIFGNLVVKGSTSSINVQTLYVYNNQIVLNANTTGVPLTNAYITVDRGVEDNAAIIWDEVTNHWQIDTAAGPAHDIVDTGGGQTIGGITTFNEITVTTLAHAGNLQVSGISNVQSLVSNTYINTNTLEVLSTANVGSLYIQGVEVLSSNFALPVTYGGTGRTSATANTVLYGNGTDTFGLSNVPTAGQVLQYRTDGIKFGGLDGGLF